MTDEEVRKLTLAVLEYLRFHGKLVFDEGRKRLRHPLEIDRELQGWAKDFTSYYTQM